MPRDPKPSRLTSTLARAAGLGTLLLGLLAACGGGTEQYEPFVAGRVIAFGDDNSALRSDGRRYGTNFYDTTTGAFDCNQQPIWVQSVAAYYGFVFAECNTATPPAAPKALMYAAPGARVADVAAQVDALVAAGGVLSNDMSLVMAGMHDVFDLYLQYPTRSEASLLAEARERGERLALVVNRLVALGSKVVVSNLPDLGLSPYARAEATADTSGFDRAALITRLTTAFNETLGVKVLLDGRFVGLAQMDLRTQGAVRAPFLFGLTDISTAACLNTVQLPDCGATGTLNTGVVPGSWLWADGKVLAAGGQTNLATLALERVQRNPF
jgi:outer membrane lipase/esterase